MISLIVVWAVLALLCLSLGAGILTLLRVDMGERLGDRIILAEWIGILVFSQVALFISLITAIQLPIAIGLILGSIGLPILLKSVRQTIFEGIVKLRDFTWTEWLKWIAIVIILAGLQTREARLYDVGAYHYPVIQWLNQFGAVPGLALLHPPFGFAATWLALSSVFNQGILEMRSASIINGFIDALVVCHITIIGQRIFRQRDQVSDWFMLIGLPTLWIGFVWIFTTSYSPDYLVAVVGLLMGWIMLLPKDEESKDSNNRADGREWLVLMLGALVCGIKLSALPIGIIGFLYFIKSRPWKMVQIIQGLSLTIVCILPSMFYGIKTSGCPVFPSNLLCLDTPWRYPSEELASFRMDMMTINRWNVLNPPNPQSWAWIIDSVLREPQYLVQLLASIWAGYSLFRAGAFRSREPKLLAAMAGIGVVFVAVLCPQWRFSVGYLTILPALGFALWIERSETGHRNLTLFFKKLQSRLSLILWTLVIGVIVIVSRTTPDRMIFPPLVQGPGLLVVKSQNGIEYRAPANGDDRCWTAPIPCTAKDLKSVELKNQILGLKGGFVHSK